MYVVFCLAGVPRGKAQFLTTKLHYDEHKSLIFSRLVSYRHWKVLEILIPPTLLSRTELLKLISQSGIAHFGSDASRNYPDVFYLFIFYLS